MVESDRYKSKIELLLDSVLPGDETLGLPSASQADVYSFLQMYGHLPMIIAYIEILNNIAQQKYQTSWENLELVCHLQCVELSLRSNVQLANKAICQLLRSYYSSESVLVQLNVGSVPPFPIGNVLKDNNWELLEYVFDRGPIYRIV